jgi:UDP-3-O-[3-hydroxymyristoyl] glucosamine N-acyltransferase
MIKAYTASYLQTLLPGSVLKNCTSPDEIRIEAIVSVGKKREHSLSFVASVDYVEMAKSCAATLLVVNQELEAQFDSPVLVVKDATLAIIPITKLFHPPRVSSGRISIQAQIDPTAIIASNSEIAPFAIIGKNVRIGKNCIIEGGAFIGDNVEIGDDGRIGPNDVIHHDVKIGERFCTGGNNTIGADGFRFAFANGVHNKIPQIGSVQIGNDVEIGANCTIDRGGLEDTIIGDGVKFDNMVHIAHNCILKSHIVIAAQSGMAGSTKVGNYVMISGHVALQDHIEIADGVMIGGKTAVRKSIDEKGIYNGEYALPLGEYKKLRKNLNHLINFDDWSARFAVLEKQVANLESR